MSEVSTENSQKKSKSLGSDKNSKRSTKSKSTRTASVSTGKQNQKGGINVFGFIPYRLSDPKYIECGWSKIPIQYHRKKITIFGVTQGKKNIFWCKSGAGKEIYCYPDGTVFSIFREDGTGEIFYQDGLPAILVTKENNRIVTTVFSEGKANLLSLRVVGRFDSYGHGIIYDDGGKVRVQYTQTWGRVIDPITGRFMKWHWKIDLKSNNNRRSSQARRILAESKKGNQFCLGEESTPLPNSILCPIPFFTIKLNDAISFRLFEQHDMCLVFYANKTCFRLELGVAVDFSKKDFYELCIDHEKEKGNDITKDMHSIHDELLPPYPKLPNNIPRAPLALQSTEERKGTTLFLHRAIKVEPFELGESLT